MENKTNLIDSIATITTISNKNIERLFNIGSYCICDAVKENIINNKDITEIEVGIGSLYIQVVTGQVRFKFVPNSKFSEAIKQTVKEKCSPLQLELENALVNKIINTYKDLI